jgi:hypothetical protein
MKKHFLERKNKGRMTLMKNKRESKYFIFYFIKVVVIGISFLLAQLVINYKIVPRLLVFSGFIKTNDTLSIPSNFLKANDNAKTHSYFGKTNDTLSIPSNFLEANDNAKTHSYFRKTNDTLSIPSNFLEANNSANIPNNFIKAYYNELKTNKTLKTEKKDRLFILSEPHDSVSADQAYKRNQFLFNSLQMHQSIVANFEKAAIDSVNQARLFYVTLMAALLAIIVIKEKKMLGIIGMVIIIVIMFYLDVHYLDLKFRQHESVVTVSYTKDSLANISPSSIAYNNIDFDKLRGYTDYLDATAGLRKGMNLVNPDLDQDILYIKPFLLVLWMLIYSILDYLIEAVILRIRIFYNKD